jgi:hypothetical protein
MPRAVSYSAITLPSGSHTGRVTPRVTLNCTSFDEADSASMPATPRSRSCCRLAIDSAWPVQVVVTQWRRLRNASPITGSSFTSHCRIHSWLTVNPRNNMISLRSRNVSL